MSHPGKDYFNSMNGKLPEKKPEAKVIKPPEPKASKLVPVKKTGAIDSKLMPVMYDTADGRIETRMEVDAYKTLEERLAEEGAKFDSKFGDILYPKAVLAAYDRVVSGQWDIWDGNPEPIIDNMLKEFMESVGNRTEYLGILKTALMDEKTKTCLVLRLTYAALMEESVEEISVHTVRRSALTCQDANQLIQSKDDGMIYVGDSPLNMEESELDKKANEFYSQKNIISQKTTGIEFSKREKLAQKVVDLGFEFIQDQNLIYNEMQYYKNDYEVSLVARLAFLLLLKDDNINPKLLG